MPAKYIASEGEKIHYLELLKLHGHKIVSGRKKDAGIFKCHLCGSFTLMTIANFKSEKVKSCGCMSLAGNPDFDYGKARRKYENLDKRTYNIWLNIKNRCYTESSSVYDYYGGKGVRVCKRWLGDDGYENFLNDMGASKLGYDIDRIDENGNYEPENCRWVKINESRFNRGRFSNNTSGKTGVVRCSNGRWNCRINVNKERINLGTYDNFDYALEIRELAEIRHYGYPKDNTDLKIAIISAKEECGF